MRNLFTVLCLIFLMIISLGNIYSQCNTTNLGFDFASAVPDTSFVGDNGFVYAQAFAIGCPGVPKNGVVISISISDNLDMGMCQLVNDYGVWSTIGVFYENNATVIWLQNTKSSLNSNVNLFILQFPFTSAIPTPQEHRGVVNAQISYFPPYSGDYNDGHTEDDGTFSYFVVFDRVPTPINLGSFSANVKDCSGVEINWTTYSETNVDKIEVQKSYDGKIYETIAAQKSKGNATMKSNYSVLDGAPLKSGKVYYRLKTIDLDGSISYSRIIPVTVNCDGKSDMTVYPNPTHGPASVQFSGFKAGSTLQVALLNAQGQVLKTIMMDPDERNSLDLTDYPGGVYFLKVLDDQNTLRTKIIKVN